MTKKGFCQFCQGAQQATLHLKFNANNAETFLWVCDGCKRFCPFKGDAMFIAKEKVFATLTLPQIEALPKLFTAVIERCAVCGSREFEVHHWAPRAIFGPECDDWPKDYLCKTHHDEWHKKITPQLVKP